MIKTKIINTFYCDVCGRECEPVKQIGTRVSLLVLKKRNEHVCQKCIIEELRKYIDDAADVKPDNKQI